MTYVKLSGPGWLTVATNGALTGLPTGGAGVSVWCVRVTDGFGESNIARLTLTIYPTNNYGTLAGSSTASGYINRVQIGNLDNTSGSNSGYADFRNLIAQINPGQTVNYTLTPGGNVFNTMACTIWIDFNGDGDFADSGEMIVTTSASFLAKSGSFTVPSSATVGPSRMRIAMIRSSSAVTSPTGAFSSGEVEDYSVQIGTNAVPNAAPYFLANPLMKPDVAAGSSITGTLAGDVSDWEGDSVAFSKVGGPAWLTVGSNGALSGTAPAGAGGLNSFTVSVTDTAGGTSAATLQVNVLVPPAPPTLSWTNLGGGQLQFSWTGGGVLQSQTNGLIPTGWVNYPGGGTSPVSITINSAPSSAFFRALVSTQVLGWQQWIRSMGWRPRFRFRVPGWPTTTGDSRLHHVPSGMAPLPAAKGVASWSDS